jgi:hypothetical protein
MSRTFVHVIALTIAMVAYHSEIGRAQVKVASWLDEPKPASWNTPGVPIPAAPRTDGNVDPRCRDAARSPQLEEDKRLR